VRLGKYLSESQTTQNCPRSIVAEDFSNREATYLLPYQDYHKDIRIPLVSAETLSDVLLGKFRKTVGACTVIDCRYPYEYEGGHIRDALNLYNPGLVERAFFDSEDGFCRNNAEGEEGRKEPIFIFHCEFSSERAPRLSRLVRKLDRKKCLENHEGLLLYPQMYILKGGYKQFFNSFRQHCHPQEYRKMEDSKYGNEYKFYRAESKRNQKQN